MLIYVKSNFSTISSIKSYLHNYLYKSFTLFMNLFIIYNLFYQKIIFNFCKFFDYFTLFDIFFKNKLYIVTKLQKNVMRKYSFNRFLVRYTDLCVSNIIKTDSLISGYTNLQEFSFKLRVIYFKKLNFLNLNNFFIYLLYWIPLHITNYYTQLSPTFGYKTNLLHQFHHIWIQIGRIGFKFKHHL